MSIDIDNNEWPEGATCDACGAPATVSLWMQGPGIATEHAVYRCDAHDLGVLIITNRNPEVVTTNDGGTLAP